MSFDLKGEKQWEQLFLTPSNNNQRGRNQSGEVCALLCVVVATVVVVCYCLYCFCECEL